MIQILCRYKMSAIALTSSMQVTTSGGYTKTKQLSELVKKL